MDFSNPIDDLDWIYGFWRGTLSAEGIDSESYLQCKKFGIDIIEIKQISCFINSTRKFGI